MNPSSFAALAAAAVQLYAGADAGYPARIATWVSLIGDRDYSTLTPEDIEDAVAQLKASKRHVVTSAAGTRIVDTGKPMAPATANRNISSLGC
jgi:hypothetical protein